MNRVYKIVPFGAKQYPVASSASAAYENSTSAASRRVARCTCSGAGCSCKGNPPSFSQPGAAIGVLALGSSALAKPRESFRMTPQLGLPPPPRGVAPLDVGPPTGIGASVDLGAAGRPGPTYRAAGPRCRGVSVTRTLCGARLGPSGAEPNFCDPPQACCWTERGNFCADSWKVCANACELACRNVYGPVVTAACALADPSRPETVKECERQSEILRRCLENCPNALQQSYVLAGCDPAVFRPRLERVR